MAITCPKCGAQNADSEYFCAACHAHIRSAFGTPATVSAPATVAPPPAITSERPKSIFAAPVAEVEPEPQVDSEPEIAALSNGAELFPDEDNEVAETSEQETEPEALPDEDEPEAEESGGEPEQTLTIVTEGTRLKWDLKRSADDVHTELYRLVEGQQSEQTGAPLPEQPAASTPPGVDVAALSGSMRSTYESLRKSVEPLVRLPAPEELAPAPPEVTPNTSGQGAQAVLPAEAKGWSWAGFVPLGAFGFALGQPLLGILGLAGLLTGRIGLFYLWPLYALVIGLKGRELAWRQRRFGSVAQYAATLGAWDTVGKVFVALDLLFYIIFLAAMAVFEAP